MCSLRCDARMGTGLMPLKESSSIGHSLYPEGYVMASHRSSLSPFCLQRTTLSLCSCHLLRPQGAAGLPGSAHQAVLLGTRMQV